MEKKQGIDLIKIILKRGLIGSVIEICMTFLITVIISICINKNEYYPVVPELIDVFGSELLAVIVQTALSFLMGFIFGLGTFVWEYEPWSPTKRTIIHFLIISVTAFIVGWVCLWIPRTIRGALMYFGGCFVTYVAIWLSMFWSQLKKIQKINDKIEK